MKTRFTIHDGVLREYEKSIFKRERIVQEIELTAVAWVTWDVDEIMQTMLGSVSIEYVVLHDDDPQLELTVFGFSPTNESARVLGRLAVGVLQRAAGSEEVRSALKARLDAGVLTTAVDLDTWEPLRDRLPPLATGTSFTDAGTIVRKPQSLAQDTRSAHDS